MSIMIRKFVNRLFLAVGIFGGASLAGGQEIGLYKDGVMIESLGMVDAAEEIESDESLDQIVRQSLGIRPIFLLLLPSYRRTARRTQ